MTDGGSTGNMRKLRRGVVIRCENTRAGVKCAKGTGIFNCAVGEEGP